MFESDCLKAICADLDDLRAKYAEQATWLDYLWALWSAIQTHVECFETENPEDAHAFKAYLAELILDSKAPGRKLLTPPFSSN